MLKYNGLAHMVKNESDDLPDEEGTRMETVRPTRRHKSQPAQYTTHQKT